MGGIKTLSRENNYDDDRYFALAFFPATCSNVG